MTLARFEDMSEDARISTMKQFMHRVAELQLVKARLTRRCRILRAAEDIAKNSAAQVSEELREAQVVYKSRILFLELWRHGAMARIASLQKTVSVSVPKSTVEAFMEELAGLRTRYHTLLTEHSQMVLEVGVLRQAKLERAGAAVLAVGRRRRAPPREERSGPRRVRRRVPTHGKKRAGVDVSKTTTTLRRRYRSARTRR